MIMLVFTVDDPGVLMPSCSYSYPETLRLEIPRKDDYFVRDVAIQAAFPCPSMLAIGRRLAYLCDEFDKEFYLGDEIPDESLSFWSCLWKNFF